MNGGIGSRAVFRPRSKALRSPGRRGAALEMCCLQMRKRSIARVAEEPICRGSLLVWHERRFLQPQRMEPTCIPRASRLSERQICHDSLAPTYVRAASRNATPSGVTSHLSLVTRGRRHKLRTDRIFYRVGQDFIDLLVIFGLQFPAESFCYGV